MKILGIIAEYNPFHLGHLYHLEKSKSLIKPDYTIAVMSGNFTQRGEAAITDKWVRASIAVNNGIDLVIELPTVFAVNTAELFAFGGIQLLNKTGCTTHISFGCEINNIDMLKQIAAVLSHEPPAFSRFLQLFMAKGLSYPSARSAALQNYFKETGLFSSIEENASLILSSPNSILAVEYLKAMHRTNSSLIPVAVKRVLSDYHSDSINRGISSATAIRKEILSKGLTERVRQSVPLNTYNSLKSAFESGLGPVDNKSFETLIMGLLRRDSTEKIRELADVTEGLENRIKECINSASDLDEFLSMLKTKRYVYTRLQRIMIYSLLNLTKQKLNYFKSAGGPQYIRVLAFSDKARPLLRLLKLSAKLPIITKGAHSSRYSPAAVEMFNYDCLSTDLYSLALTKPEHRKAGKDFTKKAVIH